MTTEDRAFRASVGHLAGERVVWEKLGDCSSGEVFDAIEMIRPGACEVRVLSVSGDPVMYMTLDGDLAQLTIFDPTSSQASVANYMVSASREPVGGTDGECVDVGWNSFLVRMVHGVSEALDAARYFLERGQLAPWVCWESERIEY